MELRKPVSQQVHILKAQQPAEPMDESRIPNLISGLTKKLPPESTEELNHPPQLQSRIYPGTLNSKSLSKPHEFD